MAQADVGRRLRRRTRLEMDWALPVLIAILGVAFSTLPAWGASITYTVDPNQSSLTISGTWGSHKILSQTFSPSSLTTALAGTIDADRDAALNTLQLTGGAVEAENSGSYGPHSVPANFGVDTTSLFYDASEIVDFAFSPTSPLLISPASFDTSGIVASVISGQFDYISFDELSVLGSTITGFDTSAPVLGNLDFGSGRASLVDTAGIETLTIPINANLVIQTDVAAPGEAVVVPLALQLSGTIVAAGVVPEPASPVLLVAAAMPILWRRRRKITPGNWNRKGDIHN